MEKITGGTMKKVLLLTLCFSFIIGAVFADQMRTGDARKPLDIPHKGYVAGPDRNAPEFTITSGPTNLMVNYYDYMIGSYNGLPIRVIPESAGGGYFLTFHGRRTAGGTRRAFYAYLDAAGNVSGVNEISNVTKKEGYSTLGVDPVSGKPMYAWHADHDFDPETGTSPEALLEVEFTSDAFIAGLAGLFNDVVPIVDNPLDIAGSAEGFEYSSDDNEFIWPTIQVGPSPVDGMRRVYVAARNSVTHNTYNAPSENLMIAYADFNGDMLEMGTPLNWQHTTIPEMDYWNHQEDWRRPFHAITTDNLGNVYYAGYHFATESDGTTNIEEEDLDIFMCPNYGEGEWTRIAGWSNLPTWNPPEAPGSTVGYFTSDETGLPYADDEMYWSIGNSSHLNAVVDNYGRIHVIGIWSVNNADGFYYPAFQTVKSFIFNPSDQSFTIKEIFPKKSPADDFNEYYQAWDVEAPFGEADSYTVDESTTPPTYYLDIETNLPFPHWDSALHEDSMYFHYNNVKLSEANEHGMMVAVWQDSQRASYGIQYPDDYPELVPYASGPEIMISVSSDNGNNWTEPIRLNAVDTPELAGRIPMWVYPADKVLYTGESTNGNPMGKIGLMFYDDYTWGSNAITPPAHATPDGGEVIFMEMEIEFSGVSNENETAPAVSRVLHQNYPNPFNPETTISFDMPKNGQARLDIFNVKGQLVKSLFNGNAPSGRTNIVWDGTDNSSNNVTSGIYFYRLSTEDRSETRKMMLMK
jgi:hypothetical protein